MGIEMGYLHQKHTFIKSIIMTGILIGGLSSSAIAGNCKKSKASYYKRCFGTCETAYGEYFRPNKVSVAHKTLPHGTKLVITNLNNGRKITARVNDKGPFVAGRDLDLSLGAMKKLGGVKAGVIPVNYCILKKKKK